MTDSRVLVCTTPIRPTPTAFPPFGSLAVLQHLRGVGHDPYFLDIDGLRPSWNDVVRTFEERQPRVVGISAVVSTAYAYTKRLTAMIKEVCPGAMVVVGGNLAASAEVLLRKAGVDVCVTGEGELPFANLVRFVHEGGSPRALGGIPGVVYRDTHDEVRFTGYERQLAAEELSDPDFSILERYSKIENFVRDPFKHKTQSLEKDFFRDPRFERVYQRHRQAGTVVSAKGCVARCTFCHRWDRGYRQLPVDKIIRRVRYLRDTYDVGFVRFGDENFGSDKRALEGLLDALRELDILWAVSGMRTRTVDRALLRRMREAGCVAVYYGIESGSQAILDVMEKNTTVEQNLRALEWTHEAGLYTIIQLVVGMPGETRETVGETVDFLKRATARYPVPPADRLSVNYAQALPGTPLYEYARSTGRLDPSLDAEERYLLEISDTDAADDTRSINFTTRPMLEVMTWRPRVVLEATQHWYEHGEGRSMPGPALTPLGIAGLMARRLWIRIAPVRARAAGGEANDYVKGGYFNVHRSLLHGKLSPLTYRFRSVLITGWALRHVFATTPPARAVRIITAWLLGRGAPEIEPARGPSASLRRVVARIEPAPQTDSERAMAALRAGR